jgi:hypothetical protein
MPAPITATLFMDVQKYQYGVRLSIICP